MLSAMLPVHLLKDLVDIDMRLYPAAVKRRHHRSDDNSGALRDSVDCADYGHSRSRVCREHYPNGCLDAKRHVYCARF